MQYLLEKYINCWFRSAKFFCNQHFFIVFFPLTDEGAVE